METLSAELFALNDVMMAEYTPPSLQIETPKQELWESIRADNVKKQQQQAAEVVAKKYEINQVKAEQTQAKPAEIVQPSSAYKTPAQQASGTPAPGYYGHYGQTARPQTSEDAVDQKFKTIREAAFKMADTELATKAKPQPGKSKNPQLEILLGKQKRNWKQSLYDAFKPGSIGRKALLVVGLVVVKGAVFALADVKNTTKTQLFGRS